MNKDLKIVVDKMIELSDLSLDFSKINRVTLHQDGIRQESDTDHTFMLSLISCSIADSLYKDKLDIGLVSQFAILHDLVEVYAGDTDTLINNSEEAKKIKEENEKESLEKLEKNFGLVFPWIHKNIERYEAQDTPEARFVKVVDKILPKLTAILNDCISIKNRKTKEEYVEFLDKQIESYKSYNDEFPELFLLFKDINNRTIDSFKI